MSLATRCSACGTVFRVVQDQLKVSEGWVRCGRCKEVFNALEALFDLEREAPPQWKAPASAEGPSAIPADAPSSASSAASPGSDAPTAAAIPSMQGALDALADVRRSSQADAGPGDVFASPGTATPSSAPAQIGEAAPLESEAHADTVAEPPIAPVVASPPEDGDSVIDDPREFADARFNSQLALEDEAAPMDARVPDSGTPVAPQSPDDAPTFLREPRREQADRPAMRAALASLSVFLVLLLAGQATYRLSDEIAARWPGSRPFLAVACETLGCKLGPLRRIDEISVESSALTLAAPGQSDAMRLSVALRNGGAVPLQAPMIDLTLTDGNGDVVSRRALSAADFRQAGLILPAGSETQLELIPSTGSQRATGYTVEIFYP